MANSEVETILVVEDESAVAGMLAKLLERAGYAAHIEPTGSRAISYIQEHSPDLVILDLRLPDMSGLDVCRVMRQALVSWSLPIIMLTGLDTPADQQRGFSTGADAYLTKPCPPAHLLAVIDRLLGEESEDSACT